jgi:hypothetical protein
MYKNPDKAKARHKELQKFAKRLGVIGTGKLSHRI